MRWQTWPLLCVMTLVSAGLAGWQYREFIKEDSLARDTLHRQAQSVMNALVGGIQSHRRRGRFFVEQLEGSLIGLVGSEDILAVGVAPEDTSRWLHTAGQTDVLPAPHGLIAGDQWRSTGFYFVEAFELQPSAMGMHEPVGGGFGRQGRGALLDDPLNGESENISFAAGGRFLAVLVLDRYSVDKRRRDAAWLRGSLVAGGMLLILGVTLAWRVTVKTAGRARQLETEARHLRELGQAAAGLAHETRNPLGLIRGWAQHLANSGFPSTEQQHQAEAIVEECDRVTARINEFLSFARPREAVLEQVDVRGLVAELAAVLEFDLDEKQLTLQHKGVADHTTVTADRELLRQALFNLVQNAIHASPRGGAIEVFVRPGQDGAKRMEVADRGPAVARDVVDSLFTPYFTTRPEGTGLGLAIVRHIANLHGWEAGYTPRTAGGSIFWLDRVHG